MSRFKLFWTDFSNISWSSRKAAWEWPLSNACDVRYPNVQWGTRCMQECMTMSALCDNGMSASSLLALLCHAHNQNMPEVRDAWIQGSWIHITIMWTVRKKCPHCMRITEACLQIIKGDPIRGNFFNRDSRAYHACQFSCPYDICVQYSLKFHHE